MAESKNAQLAEAEVQILKKNLGQIQSEKEAVLLQYQQSLEKLSCLEKELKEAEGLDERASRAETEIKILKETLAKLEAERDAGLLQYNQCLVKISSMENMMSQTQEHANGLNERAVKAETEAQNLKQELSVLKAENEARLLQYNQCLEMISLLEKRIALAEENARMLNEQAEKAETEVNSLRQAIAELRKQKEDTEIQYEQCLVKIAIMESEISQAQEDVKRLNSEVLTGVAKLKGAEEQCSLLEKTNQSLQLEAESLIRRIAVKDQELSTKEFELDKVHTLLEDEKSQFAEVEASLQILQKLHSESQEAQKLLSLELQTKLQILKDMELSNHELQEDLHRVKDENQSLNELNSSSSISMMNLQNEISSLKEMKEKLEKEVMVQVAQTNSLQQEISRLRGEIDALNRRYQSLMEQVWSVGLNPDCLGSSVKQLQDENLRLKEVCEKETGESEVLHLMNEHMQKLLEKNTLVENSLSGANVELEGLKTRSRSLEELCEMLKNEKSNLLSEKSTLVSQLEAVEQRLGNLERRFTRLEEKYTDLEKEKEFTLFQEYKAKSEHFTILQVENHELKEMSRQLSLEVSKGEQQRGELKAELETQHLNLESLQGSYISLQEENFKMLQENKSLQQRFFDLKREMRKLEEENNNIILEAASLANLSSCEIEGLKSQLSAYAPAIASLKDNIESLEQNALLRAKLSAAGEDNHKNVEMATELFEVSHDDLLSGQPGVEEGGMSDLLRMLPRVKTVEKAMLEEINRLEAEKCTAVKGKLETGEKVKSRRRPSRGDSFNKREIVPENDSTDSTSSQKNKPETPEAKNSILMKDIQLDQASGSSSRRRSKRDVSRADDQMLELWEFAEKDNTIVPAVHHTRNLSGPRLVRNQSRCSRSRRKNSCSAPCEKEVGIDKLEVPGSSIITATKQPSKERGALGKIMERLTSDGKKLASLYTSLQDMKAKVEMTKKMSKKPNNAELEKVKARLEDVEEAVVQLAEANDHLRKDVGERSSSSPEGNSIMSREEMMVAEKNGLTEQARKESEKLGRLQFEVQNIQYVLVKLEGEKENSVKMNKVQRFYGSRTGVLLRDFISSGKRRSLRRKKKACFCGCGRPAAIED
ncbi:Protein NETWORKED 1A [Linum perenne]